ncbi:RloB family protein [Paenarthrobacter ureafaciens]|uniref:RloB family protein n=1 Tax=Paenarthrobacter ureafaciens TaxID=37931 RepID=UPI003CF8A13B
MCGGIVTEKEYFQYIRKQLHSTGLDIVIESQGVNPSRLHNLAVDLRKIDSEEAKASNDSENVYKEVWVITDVDHFASELVQLAQRKDAGVNFGISNPCFEVWLVIHDESYSRPCESADIQERAKARGVIIKGSDKNIDLSKITGKFIAAEERAQRLRESHRSARSAFPSDTPSTNVDVLIRALISSAEKSNPDFVHSL